MEQLLEVNFYAVAVLTVLYMVLGMAWYSPSLFGTAWMKEMGMKMEDAEASTGMYLQATGLGIILAYVSGLFVNALGVTDWSMGACVGFWAWLGFVATSQYSDKLWSGKSLKLFGIQTSFFLVYLLIAGAVHAVWVA